MYWLLVYYHVYIYTCNILCFLVYMCRYWYLNHHTFQSVFYYTLLLLFWLTYPLIQLQATPRKNSLNVYNGY